jgi:hypothetical protein
MIYGKVKPNKLVNIFLLSKIKKKENENQLIQSKFKRFLKNLQNPKPTISTKSAIFKISNTYI